MEYLVVFLNYNDAELYRTMVKEGETAVYRGTTPKKENEEFIGWSESLDNVTRNMVVKAVFEKEKNGALRLGAMSFTEDDGKVNVIDQVVITNEDIAKDNKKETDIDR